MHTFKVTNLDRVLADWERTLNTQQINRAVKIERLSDRRAIVTTETGQRIVFVVK